jgi:hypothetical protein
MGISRAIVILALAGSSVPAQLRDPRTSDGLQSVVNSIQPWLAVTGSYYTDVNTTADTPGSVGRSIGVSGGVSMMKSFKRTTFTLSYSGSGSRYLGKSESQTGWNPSNVVSLSIGTQLSRRLTLDFGEFAGASAGGFGITSWGMPSSANGVVGSIGVAGGNSAGGGATLPPGSSTTNPLQNNLVDTQYSSQMTYFSNSSGSLGVLLSKRTMLSFGGSAYLARRQGSSFTDSNGYTGNVGMSTYWTQRFSTNVGYSFTRIDYIKSIGSTNIQSVTVGAQYRISTRDSVGGSFGESFVNSQFLASLTLPPDIALLLGVPQVYFIENVSQKFLSGSVSYNHSFQHSALGISCSSGIVPGNDLLLLSRSESCGVFLSRPLTSRLSVSGVGGASRLTGLAQAGDRYDVYNVGLTFSYRFIGGLAFTAGGGYYDNEIKPSSASTSSAYATAGLYWAPPHGLRF